MHSSKHQDAATKMDRLLKDTLELSRIRRVTNPPKDVPFGEIVKLIEVAVAEDSPAVHVDRMKIGEILVNLIVNNINYSGEQPHPKMEIGYRVDGESEETVFFVRDNGIGIDKSQHEKVFDLFYQTEKNNRGTGAGYGWNLRKGKGARFVLRCLLRERQSKSIWK